MIYAKSPLTLEEQAELLIRRGMTGEHELIIERLKTVNYYRLSAYWYPFRNLPGETFKPGTSFDGVWDRYAFDRQLRLLVMDAIERIEVAVRTQVAYHHAHLCGGPFAYADNPTTLPALTADQRTRLLNDMREEARISRETFVRHFRDKYGQDHDFMPLWMASEIMTFGCLLTFYRGAASNVRRSVASLFCVHDTVLESWLLTLNTIRNICAHHARLWNRHLGVRPKIPEKDKQWHVPVAVRNERAFGILTVIRYCLPRVAPQSRWHERLHALLADHPGIPVKAMGFPEDWEHCAIWKGHL